MKYHVAFFCFTTCLITTVSSKLVGPVGTVIVNSIYTCNEKSQVDDLVVKAELKNLDDKGNKAMFANINSKIIVDDTLDYILDMSKLENGNWKKFYTLKGQFCKDVLKLVPKLWHTVMAASKPPIPLPCPIQPGNYKIDNVQASIKDVTLPAIFYGRFQVKITWLKNNKMLSCVQAEGDSQAP